MARPGRPKKAKAEAETVHVAPTACIRARCRSTDLEHLDSRETHKRGRLNLGHGRFILYTSYVRQTVKCRDCSQRFYVRKYKYKPPQAEKTAETPRNAGISGEFYPAKAEQAGLE